jgi:hypothetical protein
MKSEKDEKLEQLSKILHSRTFRGSQSLRTFLKFIVHTALQDEAVDLKEYTIAHEVFGNSRYDSRIDSTVRVQAGRLRKKLQEYYTHRGKSDDWIIELPKGHYIPVFLRRAEAKAIAIQEARENGTKAESSFYLPADIHRQSFPKAINWLALVLAAFTFLALVLAHSYRAEALRLQSSLVSPYFTSSDADAISDLWRSFLERGRPVVIAYSSTTLRQGADLSTGNVSLFTSFSTAVDSFNGAAETASEAQLLHHYTRIGELMAVASLSRFFTRITKGFRIKQSSLLRWDDVKNENMIVLGPPHDNQLLKKLPQRESFVFTFQEKDGAVSIVNLHPTKSEPSAFTAAIGKSDDGRTVIDDYALVSFLRGPGENNSLLILAGTTSYGTQAAAEFVCSPVRAREFLDHLKSGNERIPEYFQAILRVHITDGVPVETTYLTHHPIPR